jgi:hypothetical protein
MKICQNLQGAKCSFITSQYIGSVLRRNSEKLSFPSIDFIDWREEIQP